MKEEAQRIAIAEACGWKFRVYQSQEVEAPGTRIEIRDQNGKWKIDGLECYLPLLLDIARVPGYLRDLNAMREAECSGAFNIPDYVRNLAAVLGADTSEGWADAGDWFAVLHATAAQRAEAFLRTIGKWVE